MHKLQDSQLWVGGIDDYSSVHNSPEWAVVHATQSVHYPLMGWDRRCNKPSKDHTNYLTYENGDRLSLNWVDGQAFLYDWSGPETFIKVLDFIDKWLPQKNVLIHCDQGQSRSPTLGLLFLAKRSKTISGDTFSSARSEFEQIYPNYSPSGIADYVADHWSEIV